MIMTIVNNKPILTGMNVDPDKWTTVWLATKFVRDCFHFWTEKYPDNDMPTKILDAAEAWLKNPHEDIKRGYDSLAYQAYKAIYTRQPWREIDSAANAGIALYWLAEIISSTKMDQSYNVAVRAAVALGRDPESYIDNMLRKHLTFIIDYKIENNQDFGDFEVVFESANEADKEKLLFHLDK